MGNPFEQPQNTPEKKKAPEKIKLPERVQIVYDAIQESGTQGIGNKELLEILTQHGLVLHEDGYDEVPYKISEWDETPEYDIDYVPRYKQVSVYDSDDLNDAYDLLTTKGLIKFDRASKKWVTSTPNRSWEKPLHELPEVRLLKISVEEAKGQIRRYKSEAAKAEVFAIGSMDVMGSFTTSQEKYRSHHHELTLPSGRAIDLSVTFEKKTAERQEQIKIDISSSEMDEQVLLAIEAPEGTLRDLIQIEVGKKVHLPTSELGFEPDEEGIVFRAM